jgi:hypothetical protein
MSRRHDHSAPESEQPTPEDAPHDVLAAEEFAVGAGDPALHREPAHDVLAAEEFELPSADPSLHPGPVPEGPFDPGEPPHDVLAAEEFAVPAGHRAAIAAAEPIVPAARRGRLVLGGALAVAAALLWRRRR